MRSGALALTGAFVTLSSVYMIAAFVFLEGSEIFGASEEGPLVVPVVGFAISNVLLVLFYSWVARQMDHAVKAALAIAISQALLVNVSYVLDGNRTVLGGLVSTVVLLVAWTLVGLVYGRLSRRVEMDAAQA